jgi:diguanylate cyclase (GGDEF)-like protein
MRMSYGYSSLLLLWAAALGATGLQYYGQYTAYIIGICSIAFLFYQETPFTIFQYLVGVLTFGGLSMAWGAGNRAIPEFIGIISNTVIVNVVAVLVSRINLSMRFRLYFKDRLITERNFELKMLNSRLEELAGTDCLTGVANRLQLDRYLEACLTQVESLDGQLAIVMVDIDHFKRVNDNQGHQAGDLALQELARLVRKSIRGGDLFGRWGGEEFLLLYPSTGIDQAMVAAENLRQRVREHQFVGGLRLTCSFGVAAWRRGDTPKSFIARADQALYQAKNAGRNQVSRIDN